MLKAKQIEKELRRNDGWTRSAKWAQSKMSNDPLRLAEGQSRRMRRWRDLYRWAARELGEEKMNSEAMRAQVIALVNAILASEDIATNPKYASNPYTVLHAGQAVASMLDRLGLQDAKSSAAPGSRLMMMMGEGK